MKKDIQKQIDRLKLAVFALTTSYVALAVAILLLIYGNQYLVM